MTSIDRKEYLFRDAFRQFYPDYLKSYPGLSEEKRRAAECIMKCKTGELGYNVSICEDCGHPMIHAVSCNNRSCPCCQAPLEKKWEAERSTELIKGIAYYHIVFTVPHELNPLFYYNIKPLFKLLFKCVNETLLALCSDPKYMGAEPGIISVLHTWGQQLNFHPHIHVCLSGGGITSDGKFIETKHKGFIIPEKVIAVSFRGRFLSRLKKMYERNELELGFDKDLSDPLNWQHFIDSLFKKQWLPFIKETFNGKGNAVKYLARYSYRTAIANSRIISVDDETVSFRYVDYADNSRKKVKTVKGTEFIGLFLKHVLPSRFHRVRFAGYLSNCTKTENLKLIHKLRNTVYEGNPYKGMKAAQMMLSFYGKDICSCPECKGRLIPYPRGIPGHILPLLLGEKRMNAVMC